MIQTEDLGWCADNGRKSNMLREAVVVRNSSLVYKITRHNSRVVRLMGRGGCERDGVMRLDANLHDNVYAFLCE